MYGAKVRDDIADRILTLRQAASLSAITLQDRRAMRNLKLVGASSHSAMTTSLAAVKHDG